LSNINRKIATPAKAAVRRQPLAPTRETRSSPGPRIPAFACVTNNNRLTVRWKLGRLALDDGLRYAVVEDHNSGNGAAKRNRNNGVAKTSLCNNEQVRLDVVDLIVVDRVRGWPKMN